MGGSNSSANGVTDDPEIIEKYWKRKDECEKKASEFMKYVGILHASTEHFAREIIKDGDEKRTEETKDSANYFLATSKASLVEKKSEFIEDLTGFIDFISNYANTNSSPKVKDDSSTYHELRNCIKETTIWKELSSESRNELSIITGLKGELSDKETEIENHQVEIRKLREEIASNKDQIKKHDEEVASEAKINTIKINELQDKIQKQDEHDKDLLKKLDCSSRHVERLKYDFEQKMSDHISTVSESHNKKMEDMADMHSIEMAKKIEEHKKTMEQLNHDHKSKIEQIKIDFSEESKKQQKQQKQHEDHSNELERQLQEYKDKQRDITDSKEKLTNDVATLKDQLQSKESITHRLNETISERDETYTKAISELKSKIVNLEKDCTWKEEMYSELDNRFSTEQTKHASDITNLQSEIERNKTEIRNLKADIENNETKIAKQSAEKADYTTNIRNTKADNAKLQSTIADNEREIRNMKTDINSKETENSKLQSTLADTKAELEDKKTEILRSEGTFRTKLTALEILKNRKEQEIKDLEGRERDLKRAINETKIDLRAKTDVCDNLKDKLGRKTEEYDNLKADLGRKTGECDNLKADLGRKAEECDNLKAELGRKTDECDNLNADLREEKSSHAAVLAELQDLRRKSIIRVKLFCHRRVNIMSDFENDLMAQLKSKIETEHKDLVFEQLTDTKDDNVESDTDPTIVLCLSASRIGTDAINAVHGLHLSSKKALLMIHHKDVHALPQQSSERVLTGEDYRHLGCISDMAFLSGKGIFQCEINTSSILKLVSFIKKEGVEHKKY